METDFFRYRHGQLYAEDVSLDTLCKTIPTPFYLYSASALEAAYREYESAFRDLNPLISYAMKANSNAAVIKSFVKLGAGIDVVSGGEMARAIRAGADPKKIVMSGVGKTDAEIAAALKAGILQFNVESVEELHAIEAVAASLGKKAPIALRVNPNVDPKTHPYISTGLKKNKFGIPWEDAFGVYEIAKGLKHLEITGVSCHIGSQLTDIEPLIDSAKRVRELVLALRNKGIVLKYVDLGGGLGIRYKDETAPSKEAYATAIAPLLKDLNVRLILEPGRSLVGNAGILVTRVLYTKPGEGKTFVVVDAAMNDLMRPALYGAYQHIQPLTLPSTCNSEFIITDIVGPICETGDFLAKDRPLPLLKRNDLLAIMSAGAYGSSMSSTYNSRPLIAEIMVKKDQWAYARKPGTIEDLVKGEEIPAFL